VQTNGDNQPTDGKIKGRPSARLMWLVGPDFSAYSRMTPAGAFTKKLKEFSNPSAVASR